MQLLSIIIACFFLMTASIAQSRQPAVTQAIPLGEIKDFSLYPQSVKDLIQNAYVLTKKNLTYQYGSANPDNGGMDCSGTIYFLLGQSHLENLPRPSNEMFLWVKAKGKLYPVTTQDFNSPEFAHLNVGDLLFWEGTYQVNRYPPITHVMLYLGKNNNGERLMFGASDGRSYQGKRMWGVSVFDFKLPRKGDSARFVGYGCIPTLTCENH